MSEKPHPLLQVAGTVIIFLTMMYVAAGSLVPIGLTTTLLSEPMSQSSELLMNGWLFGMPTIITIVLSKWTLDVPIKISLALIAIVGALFLFVF